MFTAFLAYDIRRIRQNRNGFIMCIKHQETVDYDVPEKSWWRSNPGKIVFRKYGEILMHPVSKTLVIILTLGLTGLSKLLEFIKIGNI